MIAILKPKTTHALIAVAVACALTISSCAKKDLEPHTIDNNKPKSLNIQATTIPEKPNAVNIHVTGLKDRYHINPKFQYSIVNISQNGAIIDDSRNWQEESDESFCIQNRFYREHIPTASNGANHIRAPFINGQYYIYRIAYQIPGGGNQWLYTPHTKPIIVVAKTIAEASHDIDLITITYDHHATNSYSSNEHEGTIALKYNGPDLNNVKSAIFETRIASTNHNDPYYRIDHLDITYNHFNNLLIIKGLAPGVSYDIKIKIDFCKTNKVTSIEKPQSKLCYKEETIYNAAAAGIKPKELNLKISNNT